MVQKKKLDENATLIYRMGFRDPDLKIKSHDDIVLWLYNNDDIIENLFKKYIGVKYCSDSVSVIHNESDFEFIITNSNNYDIGFIDLHRKIEVKDSIGCKYVYYEFFFEAKTEYTTLGTLMHQLQLYRKYCRNSNIDRESQFFFLVGTKHPTMNDFPEFLKQQGWIFVEIPFELTNKNNKKTLLDF